MPFTNRGSRLKFIGGASVATLLLVGAFALTGKSAPRPGGLDVYSASARCAWGQIDTLSSAQACVGSTYGAGIAWLDVGQGSALLAYGRHGTTVAVDAGDAAGAEAILTELAARGRTRVDLWVLTHYDADHIGGLAIVRRGRDGQARTADDIQIGAVWDRGPAFMPNTDTASAYAQLVAEGLPAREVSLHARYDAPDISAWVVGRGSTRADVENSRGLALCLQLEDYRVYVGGDLPADSEANLEGAARCANEDEGSGKVDAWALNHHGAPDGVSPELVDLLDPDFVFVSAGRDNGHCHPAGSSLALLAERELWISGAAGRSPDAACAALAGSLASGHRLANEGAFLSLARP